jgi:ATP-dependent protease ClpP protease subunit
MARTIFLNAKKNSDVVEVNIVGTIGDSFWGDSYTREDAKNDILKNRDKKLVVNLFTEGGNLYDGLFIHDILKQHPQETIVNILGMAASAGTIIALGADKVRMSKNSSFMIHQPALSARVTPNNVDEISDELDKAYNIILSIYQSKTGLNDTELRDMMKTDKWMDAEEALKLGFVDEIFEPQKVAAQLMGTAQRGGQISEYLKINDNTTMEIQAQYEELTNSYNALQNELEEAKTIIESLEAVKASFESDLNNVNTELESVKTENENLKAAIALQTEKNIIDFVNNAVKSGKITEPLKDQYLKLAKQDFETVKSILDVAPERISIVNTLIDNSKSDTQVLNELIQGKEGWDEIDFLGKDPETLEKIKNYHPEYYSMIHKKAYPNV